MRRYKSYVALALAASLLGTLFLNTAGTSVYQVYADVTSDVIVSDAITVEGFQIRTYDTDDVGVSFRVICKAPNIGSTIVSVGGMDYKVKSMGTIYTLDDDNDNYINVNDTYLNAQIKTGTNSFGDEYSYYDGNTSVYTMGYIATCKGIIEGLEDTDPGDTYYVRTMINSDFSIATKYMIRGFVVAENDNGDEIIVYGKDPDEIVIAEIADYVYRNSLASNFQGHMFLYNNILNIPVDEIGNVNEYYRNKTLDYGWNDNLYTPGEPLK